MESKRLFVGNLPYSSNRKELEELFSDCGPVKASLIIIDRQTGRSKGFGFVEMVHLEDAHRALKKFDGYEYNSRVINVSEAKPRSSEKQEHFAENAA